MTTATLAPPKPTALDRARARGELTAEELDRLLAPAADGRSFERLQRRLLKALDGVRVLGRGPAMPADPDAGPLGEFAFLLRGHSRQDPLATYIRDVCSIPRLDREDEVRLGKRLEFLRARLHRAALDAGLSRRRTREMLEDSHMRPVLAELAAGRAPDGVQGGAAVRRRLREACEAYLAAREEFVERNLHVVVAAAASYRTYGVPLLDLVQEGNASLLRAVEKFEWRKNVRLRTYATFWVRQAVERAIASSKGIVRVPNYLQQKLRRLRREGRIPKRNEEVSLHQLAQEFDLPTRVVGRLLETERPTRSLDAPLTEGSEDSLAAGLPADTEHAPFLFEWERPLLKGRIEEVLGELNEAERTILEYRYGIGRGEPMTLEEVGRLMNVSRERVRQLQVRALRKLQTPNLLARLAAFV